VTLTDFLSLLLIALSLSADCFAVALSRALSSRMSGYRHAFRVAFFFGLFQAIMPAIGWLAGKSLIDLIADYDHWAAFFLLAGIGVKMLIEALRGEKNAERVPTSGWTLLTLSIATSLDALAVGLSFAFIEMDIVAASLMIGIVAFIVTAVGFIAGGKIKGLSGRQAKWIGGAILIGMGIRILLSHIL